MPHLAHWIVAHVCVWAGLLVPYLCAGGRRFASVLRGRSGLHIGHQLWNELSGIDHLLADCPDLAADGVLPEWIVLDAAGHTELYGAVDALYPALRGLVRRDLAGIAALIRHSYETGTMTLRITREHVSADLRRRILSAAPVRKAARAVRARTAGRSPVILLGLRVENRTLVDLEGFLDRLTGFIGVRHPGALIVLDGHNSLVEGGALIESHGESRAARNPAQVEREVAARLGAGSNPGRLPIAETIGHPIATSLAWAERCDCFISIWGASLAKYRWVCNKPGFVITSRYNLAHRRDLHIYDSPRFVEAPAPLTFVDAKLAHDRPEAPLLVDVSPGQPSFYNFELDETPVFAQIARVIEASLR